MEDLSALSVRPRVAARSVTSRRSRIPAGPQGDVSTPRGVVPGGVWHHRERRRGVIPSVDGGIAPLLMEIVKEHLGTSKPRIVQSAWVSFGRGTAATRF
jgi:hypothetical protein